MEEQINPVQQKTDKLKTLSLLNNIHNIAPPIRDNSDNVSVNIVKALQGEQFVLKTIMQLKGMMFEPLKKEWIPYRSPVMNEEGIGNFIYTISNIAETIEYSYIEKDDVGRFAAYLFRINYPYFTVYFNEYDLNKRDFNLIATLLFNFIISSLSKAKGGGHRNVVRGTYSEDVLGQALRTDEIKKRGLFANGLAGLNPFARRT